MFKDKKNVTFLRRDIVVSFALSLLTKSLACRMLGAAASNQSLTQKPKLKILYHIKSYDACIEY